MKFMIGLLFGFMVASLSWAANSPDQPAQPCVPIYDQTGLECCQK